MTETEAIRNRLEIYKQYPMDSMLVGQYCKDVDALFVALDEQNRRIQQYEDFIESTTPGLNLVQENFRLQREVERLKQLCKRSFNIMDFHTQRCPMDIMGNFSGSEEHLAEYRSVRLYLQKEGGGG